ncbi:MAG: hypothetical protein RLZZ429_1857 [Bacteroidota bacterium]|jgi:hypothetical protein
MRKLIVLPLLLVSFLGYTQFQRNNVLLTGFVDMSTSKTNNMTPVSSNSNFGTGFSVSASKFISERRFNSLTLSFSHNVTKQNPTTNIENSQIRNGLGIGLGHTILTPLAQRVYLSFPFSIGAGISSFESKNNNQTANKANGFTVGATATIGVVYLTKKKWVFSANMGSLAGVRFDHGKTSSSTGNETKSNSFNIFGGALGTAFNNMSIGIGYLIK